jgi:DNA-binding transcriptional ArsR family regulator
MPDGQNRDNDRSVEEGATNRVLRGPDLPSTFDMPLDTLQTEARDASEFLKAMGHEGRLLMLYYLCERDHSVTELERLIMSRQAAVSQQLARLRHEKLVTTRREGNQIFYSLADERVREAVRLLQRMFRLQPPS